MHYFRGMISNPMDLFSAPVVDQHLLWPVFRVLAEYPVPTDPEPLIEQIRSCLGTSRLYEEEAFSPDRLSKPRSVEMVVREIHHLWCELRHLEPADLHRRRRLIATRIVASGLPDHEQAGMMTALDYLCRLSMAGKVSDRAGGPVTAELPVTCSLRMQMAYQTRCRTRCGGPPHVVTRRKGDRTSGLGASRAQTQRHGRSSFPGFTGDPGGNESVQASLEGLDAIVLLLRRARSLSATSTRPHSSSEMAL